MKTIANTLTPDQFLAWARTQPAYSTYNYGHTRRCAVAQFLQHHEVPFAGVGGFTVTGFSRIEAVDAFHEHTLVPIPMVIRTAFQAMERDRDERIKLDQDRDGTFGELVHALEVAMAVQVPHVPRGWGEIEGGHEA